MEILAALLRHFRPRLWFFAAAHCLTGIVAAQGAGILQSDLWTWLQYAVACGLWSVSLVGGGAALCDAFAMYGQDTREADGYVTTRERLGWIALATLLGGMALSLLISWSYWDAYRLGLLLLAVYAAPPVRLARWAGGDFALQGLGLGALTFYAGIAATETGLLDGYPLPLFIAGFFLLFVAAKAFLREGAKKSAWLYWTTLAGAFACLSVGGVMAGERWAAALLVFPLGVWTVAGLDRFDARATGRFRGKTSVFGAWLLTDAAVALAALLT